MAVKREHKVAGAQVPLFSINSYIRVAGRPPYPLARALQEWPDAQTGFRIVDDDAGRTEARVEHYVSFLTESKQRVAIPVTRKIYETALYTLASVRFANFMRDEARHGGK